MSLTRWVPTRRSLMDPVAPSLTTILLLLTQVVITLLLQPTLFIRPTFGVMTVLGRFIAPSLAKSPPAFRLMGSFVNKLITQQLINLNLFESLSCKSC